MIPTYRTAPVRRVGVMPPSAAHPGLVLAETKPVWPAPYPLQGQLPVDERVVRALPAVQTNPGRVISENIFGGPVTEGDPEVVTVHEIPYRDKIVPQQPALAKTEGWVDIFGTVHGEPVPAQGRARFGRGSFGVPRAMEGFAGDAPCAGALLGKISDAERAIFDAAGKSCDNGAGTEWFNAWRAWGATQKAAGKGAAESSPSAYARAIAAGSAAPPAGWKLSAQQSAQQSAEGGGGMSTMTKVLIGVVAIGAVGAVAMKLRKK